MRRVKSAACCGLTLGGVTPTKRLVLLLCCVTVLVIILTINTFSVSTFLVGIENPSATPGSPPTPPPPKKIKTNSCYLPAENRVPTFSSLAGLYFIILVLILHLNRRLDPKDVSLCQLGNKCGTFIKQTKWGPEGDVPTATHSVFSKCQTGRDSLDTMEKVKCNANKLKALLKTSFPHRDSNTSDPARQLVPPTL